jgi:serine/threonine-protein kinase
MHGVLAPGSTFGVYLVGDCIGEGGMARIYRAEHAGLRRQVALKVLIDGFSKDPEGRERFVREARIAAAIKHPNVVNIFDVGVHEDIPYLVMELLEGTDLEKLVAQKGALEENLILDIMVPVVAGLSAVHDAGIVHRDLKPGNIFLAKGRYDDLEPKLLDFGISKATGPEQMRLTKKHGQLMGTPFYMSPEGAQGSELTALSDQYSLGVVMYECATGHAPFRASSLQEIVQMIVGGKYKPPEQDNPRLSQRLSRIIARAMSLKPEHRFKDLREMGRELLTLAGQRTQITWGLTFRHDTLIPEPAASATAVSSAAVATRAPLLPPDSPPAKPKWKKAIPWMVVGLLPLLLLTFFVDLRPNTSISPPIEHQRSESPSESAPGITSTTEPPAAIVAPAPSSLVAPSAGAAVAAPAAPADQVAILPVRVAPGRRSKRGPGRKPRRGEIAAPEQKGEDRPEWALPAWNSGATPSKAREWRSTPHTNGAPIFD